jgi:hypothetical protein
LPASGPVCLATLAVCRLACRIWEQVNNRNVHKNFFPRFPVSVVFLQGPASEAEKFGRCKKNFGPLVISLFLRHLCFTHKIYLCVQYVGGKSIILLGLT